MPNGRPGPARTSVPFAACSKSTSTLRVAIRSAHVEVMTRGALGVHPKMSWGMIVLCVVVALLLGLAVLVELARGFQHGFNGS